MYELRYVEDDFDVTLGKVMTNHSMTIDEMLECLGIDMDKWAEDLGWDGYDFDCIIAIKIKEE